MSGVYSYDSPDGFLPGLANSGFPGRAGVNDLTSLRSVLSEELAVPLREEYLGFLPDFD